MSTLKFDNLSPTTIDVRYINDICLGQLQPEDGGFYVFWPLIRGGFWDSSVLSEIATKLDELNAPWQKIIDDYHAEKSNTTPYGAWIPEDKFDL